MKKISIITLLFVTTAFSQLRVGADISRKMDLSGLASESSEGIGFTLGYERMLLGLVAVSYTHLTLPTNREV